MLPFGVTILATVSQKSEIPEGLTNYRVLTEVLLGIIKLFCSGKVDCASAVDFELLYNGQRTAN
jgi:hypothetical protein